MAATAAVTGLPAFRRYRASAISIGCTAIAVWAAGFGVFLIVAARAAAPPPHVDGIVALTGGPDRVEDALRLLAAGIAPRLLVSGIGEKTDLPALAHRAGIDPGPIAGKVELGRGARSTHGNAMETAAWARAHRARTVLVVTAWFHMPRAQTELRRAMPDVALYAFPVGRFAVGDFREFAMARRLMAEYHKYLLTWTRIGAVFRSDQPV